MVLNVVVERAVLVVAVVVDDVDVVDVVVVLTK